MGLISWEDVIEINSFIIQKCLDLYKDFDHLNKDNLEIAKNIDLSELCITSSVKVEKIEDNEILVETKKAKGTKCPVCWKIIEGKCSRQSCQNI